MRERDVKVMKYVGNGYFVPGVPMRDIPIDEWEALPEELRDKALALGLYQKEGEA